MKKSNIPSGLYWENAGRLEYSIGLKTNYDKLITKNKNKKRNILICRYIADLIQG